MPMTFWIISGFVCLFSTLFLAIMDRKIGAVVSGIFTIISFVMTINQQIPDNSLPYKGHHYFIYSGDADNWRDAQSNCNSRKGYLAVIDDEKENEKLFDYMVKMGYDQAFFGLAKNDNGEWEYMYNEKHKSDYENWGWNSANEKQPNNKNSQEKYAQLDVNMKDGHWNNAKFGQPTYNPKGKKYKNDRAYICEWDF